ncbi:hypothetical protein SS50377_24718 [Spironucleus salmonicida]|nr:hypothetical protein SS50377_24718 [Spironucleus salmonicida]
MTLKCESLQIVVDRISRKTQRTTKAQYPIQQNANLINQIFFLEQENKKLKFHIDSPPHEDLHEIIVRSLQEEIIDLKTQLEDQQIINSSQLLNNIEQSLYDANLKLNTGQSKELQQLRNENANLKRILLVHKQNLNCILDSSEIKEAFTIFSYQEQTELAGKFSIDKIQIILQMFCDSNNINYSDLKYIWDRNFETKVRAFLVQQIFQNDYGERVNCQAQLYETDDCDTKILAWCMLIIFFIMNGGIVKHGQYLIEQQIIMIV